MLRRGTLAASAEGGRAAAGRLPAGARLLREGRRRQLPHGLHRGPGQHARAQLQHPRGRPPQGQADRGQDHPRHRHYHCHWPQVQLLPLMPPFFRPCSTLNQASNMMLTALRRELSQAARLKLMCRQDHPRQYASYHRAWPPGAAELLSCQALPPVPLQSETVLGMWTATGVC